jgi:ERF superfamily
MVAKTGRNNFHNYAYATEADVVESVRPHMIENGLMLIPHVDTVNQDAHGNVHIIVNYRLYHVSGDFIEFNIASSGNDKNKNGVGDKGIYKALTGASKYAILKLFNLATGDDPENDSKQNNNHVNNDDDLPPLPKLKKNGDDWASVLKVIKTCADMAQSKEELNEWYRDISNKLVIDELKNNNEALYNEALSYLSERKKKL